MLKGKSILVAMFLLALFAVSAVSAADNATEDISDMGETLSDEVISVEEIQATGQANDDETIGETDDGTFTALQQKINGASVNATITLSNNYTYDSGFNTEGITIDKDLTIDGRGYTIDGDKKSRIFYVERDCNVVFKNITFINGYSNVGGAMSGGSAVNCTFNGNHANDVGGAMREGSAVNCTFNGNHANLDGGAMWGGSAVNCTFNDNHAHDGGAMWGGSAVNCTFNYNTAERSGGAMMGGSAVNCTFNDNNADQGDGGAMRGGSAVNCDFNGNYANYGGGAMSGGSADTCVFRGNFPNDYADIAKYDPSLSVEDYASFYNSGDKLVFNLSTHSGMRVTNRNITIDIFTSDSYYVYTYYSLSDGWVVPLDPGRYILLITRSALWMTVSQ